jgi:hypothetical protein
MSIGAYPLGSVPFGGGGAAGIVTHHVAASIQARSTVAGVTVTLKSAGATIQVRSSMSLTIHAFHSLAASIGGRLSLMAALSVSSAPPDPGVRFTISDRAGGA